MLSKRFSLILLAVPVILSIPLVAMQFSDEVNWSVFDFIIMGALLLITGVAIEIVLQRYQTFRLRILPLAVVVGIFLLIWVELAVGIF